MATPLFPALTRESGLPSALELKAKSNSDDPAAKKVVGQFEALMVHELLKAMRSTVHAMDDDEEEFGTELSTELSDQAMADHVAGRLGMGDMLGRELGLKRESSTTATPSTAELRTYHGPQRWNPASANVPAKDSPLARTRGGIVGLDFASQRHLPVSGEISSPFGARIHPISGEHSFHEGLDIAAPSGTEIRASGSGTVVFSGKRGGYGNVVELEHSDGTHTIYAHASRLHVRQGDRVEAGEAIADVGSTGHSTGPHLHFEVRRNDRAIDPSRYLKGVTTPTTKERVVDTDV